jgi:hypothetical protein
MMMYDETKTMADEMVVAYFKVPESKEDTILI